MDQLILIYIDFQCLLMAMMQCIDCKMGSFDTGSTSTNYVTTKILVVIKQLRALDTWNWKRHSFDYTTNAFNLKKKENECAH